MQINDSLLCDINLLKSLTENEKKQRIEEAVKKLQIGFFSLNDTYRQLGIDPRNKKLWNSKEEIFSPHLIRNVFKELGVCSRGKECSSRKAGTARYFLPAGQAIYNEGVCVCSL